MFLKAGRFLVEIVKVLTKAIAPFGSMALGQLLLMHEYLTMVGLAIGFSMVGVGIYGRPKLSSIKSTKNIRNTAQLLGCFVVGMVIGSGLLPMSVGYPLAIIGIVPWGRTGKLVRFLGIAVPLTGLTVPLLENNISDSIESLLMRVVWISAGFFATSALLGMLDLDQKDPDQEKARQRHQSKLEEESLRMETERIIARGRLRQLEDVREELIATGVTKYVEEITDDIQALKEFLGEVVNA